MVWVKTVAGRGAGLSDLGFTWWQVAGLLMLHPFSLSPWREESEGEQDQGSLKGLLHCMRTSMDVK